MGKKQCSNSAESSSDSDSTDSSSSESEKKRKKSQKKDKKKEKKAGKKVKEKKDKKEKKAKKEKEREKMAKRQNDPKEDPGQKSVDDKEKMKRHLMGLAQKRSLDPVLASGDSASGSGGEGAAAAGTAKDVVLSVADGAFRSAEKPFGMDLDGALVVDVVDDSPALDAGVQIGWRVHAIGSTKVPAEEEGAAAKILRAEEMKAAAALDGQSQDVHVRFVTEEPAHWKQALRNLKGTATKKARK